jgi:hypothetical protein
MVAAAQGQPGQDELWEVTGKIEMAGMPIQMPTHTQQVCKPKGAGRDEDLVPTERDCRVTDVKRSGNRMTFTMVCEGKNPLTGTGDVESDANGYRGATRMKGTMDGQPVDMTQTFSARRVGTCTYEDPRKKHDAMMAEQCTRALDQMSAPMFITEQSPCKSQKAEFCSRVSSMAQGMRTPAGYRAGLQKRSDWSSLMSACGQDPSAVTREACAASVRAKQYDFTVQHCEAESKALAAQHCEGMDYTAAMSSEYAAICRQYAATRGVRPATPGSRPAGQPQPSAQPQAPAQQPSAADALKEGADTLRRFLRW